MMDDEGTVSTVEPIQLADNEKVGLGGLRVVDATSTYRPPTKRVMQPPTPPPSKESEPLQVATDDLSLINANQTDLKLRNLK